MADNNSKIEDERTLAKIIAEKGVLSVKDAAVVTLQLVTAVSKLHSQGKIHRQISANTVRLDKTMSPTLDPIAREITLGGIGVDLVPSPPQLHNIPPLALPSEIKAAQQVLTQAGILLEPRQIDFYQLGALLCLMVSGHSVSDYLRSCKAKADVPEEIAPIIDRALGMNAKEQFESTETFIFELEAVISGKPAAKDRSSLPDSIFIEPLSKPETDDEMPFKKIGHYQIIERIGHGGMGDVYKGYEKALDRFVAIKVLPAQLARQKDFVKRFHAEATAIAKIDHPNIVRIYYSGEDQGHHFFAMQYVDGESLADLLKRCQKLSASEAMPIIEQCLAGIGAAHKKGLIHRDIKPGNVLLDRHSRRALVADFGVVKSNHAGTQITVTGTIMGTADYIAPEQARGLEVDCRSDLYAMGILMYQMLSGKLPFEAKSATSMMFQHAYEPPPLLFEVAPDVPEQLADVVMKLIAKQPEDRYQSTDEVLCDLHNLRLKPQATSCSSQISIIEAPRFYTTPEIPHNLSRLTGKNWFGRLRNRITDFFGNYAPQVVEYMQTTTQQVDGAVAEYQRRRDKLAQLAKEAKAAAMEFEAQAKASRKAAQVAGERAEVAKSTTAKQQALKEKQENEQTAAELAQLAAEQAEQSEEISLRLAKLNAKLVQLRSQRDALNARMNAARVYMGKEDILLAKRKRRRIIVYAVFVMLVFSFSATLIYMLFGGRAGIPVGKWESVDFVKEIKYFKPGEKQWTGNLHLKGLTFYKDGKTSGPWTWEKGWLWHPEDKTKARFFIKQIGGSSYLFMEWMSGDVTIRGQKPSYYVLQKASDVVAYIVSFKSIHPFETRTAKELLNTFNNRHTQGTRTHHFRTEIKNGKLIGHICVDDEFSKATLAKLLEKNDKLMLVGTRAVNQQEFEEHCRLGQPSLPPLGGSQIDSGLIAHWKFDEGSGNTAHASAGNNHGTIYGATWTAGQVGDALSFDGDGDYVNIKSSNALSGITDNFTISLWARPLETHQIDTESNASWPGSAGQRYALMPVHGDGMWGAGHVGAGISIGTNGVSVYEHTDRYMPPMLVWQGSINKLEHITVVYDNKQPKLYINGTLKRTGIKSGKIVHALPSTIGGASSGYFKGVIDEVRIYSRALSAQEIQQLYRSRTVAPSFGSNIIIPGVGIGDFRLGMSKEDVIKAMGTPKRIFNVFMIFDDISFGITNDVVRSITALGPSYKFANGLTVGDPQQKVIETFGNDYELEHFDFKDFMRYKDKGLVFEIRNDNKTVMEIEVISKPGTSNHYMALREAAENGHSQTVETLINEGADVNTKYDSEYTPLHLAAKNGHIETCLKLISKGANINAASVFGETPLHLAAKNGHQQTVQAIIDEGVNVNAETKSGKTPLQLAKENGHSQTAHVLIASEVKTSRPEGWFSTLQSKEWWRRTMEFFILFGLMALVFISPIFAYALIFKSVGIITRNSKCSYLRSLLISFIFLLVIFGIHCLAVALRRTALIHSDNLIYLIVEWGLAIGCGTMLFKKTLSIKPVFSIILSTEIFFAQLWVVVFVIGNMFRM